MSVSMRYSRRLCGHWTEPATAGLVHLNGAWAILEANNRSGAGNIAHGVTRRRWDTLVEGRFSKL